MARGPIRERDAAPRLRGALIAMFQRRAGVRYARPAFMEWLTLLLLVPAIVVPVVLLFGFAGCLTKPPRPEEPVFQQAFAATFTDVDALRGRCLVQRIEPVRLFLSGSQVQITLQAMAESVVIDRILISQPAASGDPYDSADDLTDVATAVTLVQPNSSLTLPRSPTTSIAPSPCSSPWTS